MNCKRLLIILCLMVMVFIFIPIINTVEFKANSADNNKDVSYSVSGALSSNMVIQRDKPINVWGFSDLPGDEITVKFMGDELSIIVTDGKWIVTFPSHEYTSQPQEMIISSKNDKYITKFEDILIGDVWLVSGQSNSTLPLSTTIKSYPEFKSEIKATDLIRVYGQYYPDLALARRSMFYPDGDVIKSDYCWSKADWKGVSEFSALGYHYAKALSEKIDVPIGVIMIGRGGAALNQLMSPKRAIELGYSVEIKDEIPTGGIYNGFMYPFLNISVKGMLFYQGESSGKSCDKYVSELKYYVEDLRKEMKCDFSFYSVQLATLPTGLETDFPNIPMVRSEQLKALKSISDSYIVVSQDVGWIEGKDTDVLHPNDKKTLGERLARLALAEEYNISTIEYESSPIPTKLIWKDNYLLIDYKYVGDGLKLSNGTSDKLVGFQILKNGKMFDEIAEILDKDTVRISIDSDTEAVGYGMSYIARSENANLCNSSDLPSPSFQYEKGAIINSIDDNTQETETHKPSINMENSSLLFYIVTAVVIVVLGACGIIIYIKKSKGEN